MAREELIVGIGADVTDLISGIREAKRQLDGLSDQLAQSVPNFSREEFLNDIIGGAQEAAAEMGLTVEQAGQLQVILDGLRSSEQQTATASISMAQGFQGASQQQAALSAEVRSFLAVNAKLAAGFQESARQARAQAAAAAQVETATQRMSRAFQESGKQAAILSREVRNSVSGSEAMARGIAAISTQNRNLVATTVASSRGINLLRSGLAQTVATTLAVRSATASTAQGLLFALGASSGTIIGVLAGLAILAKGIEVATREMRKQREETEKNREALRRLREEQRDPIEVATALTKTAEQDVRRLSASIQQARLEQQQAISEVAAGNTEALERAERAASRIAALSRQLIEAAKDAAAGTKNLSNVTGEADEERIQRLTTLLSLGAATVAQESQLQTILTDTRAALAKTTGDDEASQKRRLALAQRIASILAAQKSALELDAKPAEQAFKALTEQVDAALARVDLLRDAKVSLGRSEELDLDTEEARRQVERLRQQVDDLVKAAGVGAKAPLLKLDAKLRGEQLKELREDVADTIRTLDLTVQVQADADPAVRAVREALGIPIPVFLDSQRAIAQAELLRDTIGREIASFGSETDAPAELVAVFNQLNTAIQNAVEAPVRALITGVNEAVARFQVLQELTAGTADQTEALQGPLEGVRKQYAAIVAEVEAQGGPLKANLELLREQAALAALLKENQGTGGAFAASFRSLRDTAEAVTRAREELTRAELAGDRQAVKGAEERLKTLEDRARRLGSIIADALSDVELDPGVESAVLAEIERLFKLIGIDIGKANAAAVKLVRTMEDITDSVDAFADLATQLGIIDDQAAQAFTSLSQVGEAAARIASGDLLGGIIQGAGALSDLIGGVFGGGPSETDQLIAENNRRLAEVADELSGFSQSVSNQQRAAEAALKVLQEPLLQNPRIGGQFFDEEDLRARLRELGISFEQLEGVAAELGIDLGEGSKISVIAFRQLVDAIGLSIEAITHFGDSISDREATLATQAELDRTAGDPVADLERQRQILLEAVNLDPFIEAQIAALDLATKEGRDAFRAFLQDLFDKGLLGFDPTELVGDVTAEDILRLVREGAGALNDFEEATRDATQEMLNVPTGFKLAAARFNAEIAGLGPAIVDGLVPNMDPGRLPGHDGAQLPPFPSAPTTVQFNFENLTIEGGTKDPQQLLRDLIAEAKRMSMSKFGTPDMWGQL